MKKSFIVVMIIFCVLVSACSQNQSSSDATVKASIETTTNGTTPTTAPQTTEQEIGRGGDGEYPCEHVEWYHNIEGYLIDYVNSNYQNDFNNFVDMFCFTEDFNTGFLCRYYGISKEEYPTAARFDILQKVNEENDGINDVALNVDAWFSDNYATNPVFLKSDTSKAMLTAEWQSGAASNIKDTAHIDTYYTIHYSLVDYVGQDKFKEFQTKFEGTEDFNILNFIKYFNIDESSFTKIMESISDESYAPYNAKYVYGTKEMQDKYFLKRSLTTTAVTTTTAPKTTAAVTTAAPTTTTAPQTTTATTTAPTTTAKGN